MTLVKSCLLAGCVCLLVVASVGCPSGGEDAVVPTKMPLDKSQKARAREIMEEQGKAMGEARTAFGEGQKGKQLEESLKQALDLPEE